MKVKIIYTIISIVCLIPYAYNTVIHIEPIITTRLLILGAWFSILAKLEDE